MVQFTKLRLHGFKSFVDPTVMEIGPGITGIVGPNGCGKSNLVEALRWVMGESSAKRMRGSSMEDVIFAGTKKKPARNSAEVTVWLDNKDRTAPAELNNHDELEIIRNIERDKGSTYRANGKIVRARDVQILFADSSIGSHSPAMVSQGRVADLISAKPTQRRLILEEAAGISGLHARRHEAELKFRAAEKNLTRVEDVLGTMDMQMQGLKKQARQASRYRNLSEHIKKAEAQVLYLQWQQTETAVLQARQAFKNADDAVRDHTLQVTKMTTEYTNESATLPELRKNETDIAASLQHLNISYGSLEKDMEQLDDALRKNTAFLEQVDADISHGRDEISETELNIKNLTEELKGNDNQKDTNDNGKLENLEKKLDDTKTELEILKTHYAEKKTILEEQISEKQRLTQALENSEAQTARLSVRWAHLKHEKVELQSNIPDHQKEEELQEQITEQEKETLKIKSKIDELDKEKLEAEVTVEEQLSVVQEKKNAHSKLTVEIETLEQILQTHHLEDNDEPIIGKINVKNGMEKALAVALGEDADATEDKNSAIYWTTLPEMGETPPLPKNVEALTEFVTAPKALARRLSLIGVVETDEQAKALLAELKSGQCLVTKEGSAWRWDGLITTANAPSTAAIRLEQKNKLTDCKNSLPEIAKSLEKVEQDLAKMREGRDSISSTIFTLRSSLHQLEQSLHKIRLEHTQLTGQNADMKARIIAISNNISDTTNELDLAKEHEKTAKENLDELPEHDKIETEIEELQLKITEKQQDISSNQSQYDRLLGAKEMREQRLTRLKNELETWSERELRQIEHLSSLQERKDKAELEKATLKTKPSEMEDGLQSLLSQISKTEEKRDIAADKLATVENKVKNSAQQLKKAETGQADAREARAHAQATVATAQQTQEMIIERANEKFSSGIKEMMLSVEINVETEDLPELGFIQTKLDKLLRERDGMGPVNLRADIESDELIEQMNIMATEKDDLTSAISRLRQGISKLNKEARERLLQAFDVVNAHFSKLFTQLFNGGQAHLKLTDAEDPLEAGLEIFAQPPGKRMQVLSLFSGGEQTLTSIALIFSMFLTNPAPICVLDEIDAPLDDSNVDLVCSLIEKISKETSTRFIVISHHRMTMARMDRLYGVTMSEQGVSQLVSVDLQQPSLLDHLVVA